MPRRYDHRLASRRAPVESTPAGCTTPPCGAPRISCIPCVPRDPSVPRAPRPLHRDRSGSASRSVVLRVEIGHSPHWDRFTSTSRSVRFCVEIVVSGHLELWVVVVPGVVVLGAGGRMGWAASPWASSTDARMCLGRWLFSTPARRRAKPVPACAGAVRGCRTRTGCRGTGARVRQVAHRRPGRPSVLGPMPACAWGGGLWTP